MHDGKERGVVQVFRQFACPVSHATLPIYALDPAKHYCKQPANPDSLLSLIMLVFSAGLSSWDGNIDEAKQVSGATLLEEGLRVAMTHGTPFMGNASAAVIEIAEC